MEFSALEIALKRREAEILEKIEEEVGLLLVCVFSSHSVSVNVTKTFGPPCTLQGRILSLHIVYVSGSVVISLVHKYKLRNHLVQDMFLEQLFFFF